MRRVGLWAVVSIGAAGLRVCWSNNQLFAVQQPQEERITPEMAVQRKEAKLREKEGTGLEAMTTFGPTHRIVRFGIAVFSFFILTGCLFPTWTYRFRLTVLVETPESIASGRPIEASGVWQFAYQDTYKFLGTLQGPSAGT